VTPLVTVTGPEAWQSAVFPDRGEQVFAVVDCGGDLPVVGGQPDVAVVDVRLPPSFTDEGLRAALTARSERPGLPILVLSQYVEQLYARELLADGAGAVGYLLKDRVFDSAEFTDAVRRVADGGTAMDPEVIPRLLASSILPLKLPLEMITDHLPANSTERYHSLATCRIEQVSAHASYPSLATSWAG
jgi:DNA-binding NarL/FixJ family response regulator